MIVGESPDTGAVAEALGFSRNQAGILAAYVELIEELGTDDVSFRLIARRAGVGERTVFRHYGTRSDLLLAAAGWLEHVIFAEPAVESVFDVPLAIRQRMEAFGRRPELAHVAAETMMRGVNGIDPAPGKQHLNELLAKEVPSLPDLQRREAVASLTHLSSAGTWVSLRREFGMEPRDIADAAAWSAEAILNPLRQRTAA